jgi:hypothetical protein
MVGQKIDILAVFDSICNGYSVYDIDQNLKNINKIYFKHLTYPESLGIKINYEIFFDEAIKSGILSESDQIKLASEKGWWTEGKESEIASIDSTIKRLNITKSKLIYNSDKDRINEQIDTERNKLNKLKKERSSYIIMTAEEWATRKTSDFFISNFAFKNSGLSDKIFGENLDEDEELVDLVTAYYFKYLSEYSNKIIKTVAISTHFQNILFIGSSSSEIFGTCIIKLTRYQHDLLVWGKYYQNIIKNSTTKVPDDVYEDPDKLEEWFESVKNSKNTSKKPPKSKGDGGSKFLFGDRNEIKNMTGGEISGDRIIRESQSKGGMGIYDLANKS